jgi:hypothetical protein
MSGRAVAGAIVCGPLPAMANAMVSVSLALALALAALMACLSVHVPPQVLPAVSRVEVTVNVVGTASAVLGAIIEPAPLNASTRRTRNDKGLAMDIGPPHPPGQSLLARPRGPVRMG